MLGGGLVKAPARRALRWFWAARTSSSMVGRLSGGDPSELSDGSGIDCGLRVEVAMSSAWCEVRSSC
jgi:hypothetical protein